MEKVLASIYYDPSHPAGYGGVQKLYRAAKTKLKSVRLPQVQRWLQEQATYTLHKPIRRKFSRSRTQVEGIDHQWQADLADVSHLATYNRGYKYLFCVIDVFSKFAWVVPLTSKSSSELVRALKLVLKQSGRHPLRWQTDKGTEFLNQAFQKELKKRDIHFFTTENPETKASIVERFQRTLKERMWKYFTHQHTLKYIDVLPHLVQSYNQSYHRSIGRAPQDVTPDNEVTVFERLFGTSPSVTVPKKGGMLATGDWVRIGKTKRTFDKGYLPNWTTELFRVTERVRGRYPPVYKLEDMNGEVLKGTFYLPELQRVTKKEDDVYEIESILDRRTRKVGKRRVKEVKVHWKGYPSSFDSWIDASQIIDYKKK
jgi:transposase InsO family protein